MAGRLGYIGVEYLVNKKVEGARHHSRGRWWWYGAGSVLVALVVAFLAIPGLILYHQVTAVRSQVARLEEANRAHNFTAMVRDAKPIETEMGNIAGTLGWMPYWRIVPGIGGKYRDGEMALEAIREGFQGLNLMVPALSKVAPLVGYKSGNLRPSQISGHGKLSALLSALPILVPDLKRAYPDFVKASDALDQVHPGDFGGFLGPIGAKLLTAQSLLATAVRNIPLIDQSSQALQNILGDPNPKRYLLVFQNSGELRSTGGFMTAYGFVTLNHGHLGPVTEQNMYLLDARVTYRPPASTVIGTYLPVLYWHLRDANTSPNVPTTVSYIKTFYESIPGVPRVNGVIFIDTWFVDSLIGDVGGITVPTPKGPVSLNQKNANLKMEFMAEAQGLPNNMRKKFIGTMMKSLLHQVFHAHGSELARVVKTVEQSLNKKFILLNFNNPRDEAMVRRYHWGGIMDRHVRGDYLSIVDENLLGHKDNYVMNYHLSTRIRRVGSRYQETASITYRDPAIDTGALFVPYRSWVRFYVPVGSTLISMTGNDGIPYQSYVNTTVNKTVFGGHENLPARTSQSQPVATNTVTVTYWLPPHLSVKRLTVQLQPGVNHQTLTVMRGSYRKTVPFTHDMVFHMGS